MEGELAIIARSVRHNNIITDAIWQSQRGLGRMSVTSFVGSVLIAKLTKLSGKAAFSKKSHITLGQ